MEACGANENSFNSNNVKTQDDDKQQQETIASSGKESTSSTPLKRKAVLSPSILVMAQASSRKLQKIEEHSVVSLTDVPEKAELTVKDLDNVMKHLFSDRRDDCRVLQLPCTSARLFACYGLICSDSKEPLQQLEDTPRRSSRLQQKNPIKLEPILPFLKALVQIELASLDDNDDKKEKANQTKRIVGFSGFDCSSTNPPIDRVDGSGEHQSNTIRALTIAKDSLDAMCQDEKNRHHIIKCLELLALFLAETLKTDPSLVTLCADSITCASSLPYPVERLSAPINLYASEIGNVIQRLKGEPALVYVERHLSDLLCSSIRHHLRLLLNPPPPRLTPADKSYEERSKAYSKIHELVQLSIVDEKNKEWEVEGERLASLFNEAAKAVCNYFGSNNLLDPSYQIPTVNAMFCQSDASQRQIPNASSKTRLAKLTQAEVETVQEEVIQAFDVLITASQTKFLIDLLSKKVQEEIKRLGGWEYVETFATLLWRYELWENHPDYEHFVLFSNMKTLEARLESIKQALETPQQAARVCLEDLARRFRVNSTKQTKTKLVKIYPEIRDIEEVLNIGWETVRAIATVAVL